MIDSIGSEDGPLVHLLPYVERLVLELLRRALGPGATVESTLADPLRRTPYVYVDVVGGDEVDPVELGVPLIEVECYAKGSKRAAADLSEDVRSALYSAWLGSW